MELEYGRPLRPYRLAALRAFLAAEGLDYDEKITYTVNLLEGEEIVASGSMDGNIFKCIAVADAHQGEGLTATIITELRKEAFEQGLSHLFLFTKPKNRRMFGDLGFFPVAETRDTLLMENIRDGVKKFVAGLPRPAVSGVTGAAVVNCNPFTLGHRYLIQRAAAQCDTLHVFVLSEDKSRFSAALRMELVQAGTVDLPNVWVHPTGDYLISSATFPTYFIQDKSRAEDIRCQLDLEVFASCFAPPLGITRRFVGTEPLSPVTCAYNRQMQAFLPQRGIQVIELPRKELQGQPISASRVRQLLDAGDLAGAGALVPESTFRYLQAEYAPRFCAKEEKGTDPASSASGAADGPNEQAHRG